MASLKSMYVGVGSLLIVLVTTMAVVRCRERDRGLFRGIRYETHDDISSRSEFELYLKGFRKTVDGNVTMAFRNEVSNAFVRLVAACQMQRVEEARLVEKMKLSCQPEIREYSVESFHRLYRPLEDFLGEGFCDLPSQKCQSARELADIVETRWIAVKILGDCLVSRGDYEGPLMCLEALTLEMLLDARSRYMESGSESCQKVIDEMLGRCRTHIDSEAGFMRFGLHCVVRNLEWLERHGVEDRKERPKKIRQMLSRMIELGHTPAWIGEFDGD